MAKDPRVSRTIKQLRRQSSTNMKHLQINHRSKLSTLPPLIRALFPQWVISPSPWSASINKIIRNRSLLIVFQPSAPTFNLNRQTNLKEILKKCILIFQLKGSKVMRKRAQVKLMKQLNRRLSNSRRSKQTWTEEPTLVLNKFYRICGANGSNKTTTWATNSKWEESIALKVYPCTKEKNHRQYWLNLRCRIRGWCLTKELQIWAAARLETLRLLLICHLPPCQWAKP